MKHNLVTRQAFALPFTIGRELLTNAPSVNMLGNEKDGEKFARNPIRYDSILEEQLKKACSLGLVICDEAEECRYIKPQFLVTDQKVIVKDKVLSIMDALQDGTLQNNFDNCPVVVHFEFGDTFIIRDGNHRASAMVLLGYNEIPCKVIHVKHSFL